VSLQQSWSVVGSKSHDWSWSVILAGPDRRLSFLEQLLDLRSSAFCRIVSWNGEGVLVEAKIIKQLLSGLQPTVHQTITICSTSRICTM
jgi:hypothetical protein